jgi:hypothetical protein
VFIKVQFMNAYMTPKLKLYITIKICHTRYKDETQQGVLSSHDKIRTFLMQSCNSIQVYCITVTQFSYKLLSII